MAFITESTGYEKTALSDLQCSWGNLRMSVVDNFGFPESDKLLFHIDEAMSWESVRNLSIMKRIIVLIQNISIQTNTPNDVIEFIEDVRENMDAVLKAIAEGELQ